MWRFLSSPWYCLPGLMLSSALSRIADFAAATWARGARMREASLPQTTFSPCRPLSTNHPILPALMAPGERRGGPPLLQIGPRCAPCLLARCPPQLRLAAIPSRGERRPAALRAAPSGSTPVSINRHKAMRNLRAKATIPMRRSRLLPGPKRCGYHGLSALWGCQRRQPQAISLAMARMGALPALVMPCSSAVWPLA
jgi:hypothetical protein